MENTDEITRKQNLLQKEIIGNNYDKEVFVNFCLSKKEEGDDLNNYTYEELEAVVKEFISKQQKESEVQKKQELLQKEIISKNYDKTIFINFCLSKKKNGDDLNEYTYDELVAVVKEFIASQKKEAEPEKKEEQQTKPEHEEKVEKFNAEDDKNFKEKKITCKKLEKTQLNDKEIKVVISNPKTVDGGMFGKSYIKYVVATQPLDWRVERRYSDFDTLRKLIQKYYPSFYVPPLPLKKIGTKNFSDSFIHKRMKFLNKFINAVVKSESFKASEILYAFLNYTDRAKFESKFKEYQTRTPTQYVEEYKTLDGIITISLDAKNENYFTNINKYFKLQDEVLDKVNVSLKTLNHSLKTIRETIQEIHKNFTVLHVLNSKVMMKPNITKTMEEISNFFQNWGNIITKQRLLIKDHIKDFFYYVNLEGKAYNELIQRREDLKQKYNNENARVTMKKEKLFNLKDIFKMEIDYNDQTIDKKRLLKDKPYAFEHICIADTRELERINNQLGYANKMNMRELKKMLKEYCVRYVNNIAALNQEFNQTIGDMNNISTNLENFVKSASDSNAKK